MKIVDEELTSGNGLNFSLLSFIGLIAVSKLGSIIMLLDSYNLLHLY